MMPLPFAPRYVHIGGEVFCANGRKVELADAIELANIWGREALKAEAWGQRALARVYARDAMAIFIASEAAKRHRGSGGGLRTIQAVSA